MSAYSFLQHSNTILDKHGRTHRAKGLVLIAFCNSMEYGMEPVPLQSATLLRCRGGLVGSGSFVVQIRQKNVGIVLLLLTCQAPAQCLMLILQYVFIKLTQ